MSIQWKAYSDNDGYGQTVGSLARGSRVHDRLGTLSLTGGSEVLLTVQELRELATVAGLIADDIEASS